MSLKLYRRHRSECEGGHAEDSKSGEFEEGRRGWKRCACVIHASGTIGGTFNRKQTGEWEWDAARSVVAGWERAGTWNSAEPEPPRESIDAPKKERIGIADATDAFLAKCQNRGIRPVTYAKYKTFVNQLRAYGQLRGYVYLDQLTVSDMDRFYSSWEDGIRAKAKKLERLKAFVKFSIKREWIAKDIASDLEAPEGASVTIPKAPFTDDELKRIFDACDALGPAPGPPRRNWGGEDVKDFIYLSI